MRILILFFILIVSSCLTFSCSIEKKHHLKGYHITFVKKKSNFGKINKTDVVTKNDSDILEQRLTASIDNEIGLSKTLEYIPFQKNIEDCDVIILKNADEIKAKVIEITETDIKYRKCNESDDKIYSYRKSEVFMIKYPNGSKEIIKAPTENHERNYNDTQSKDKSASYEANEIKKVNPFSLVGFIFSAASVFALAIFGLTFGIFAIPMILALLGLIFSITGIIQINKKPEKFKGKVFSVLGIIFGLIFLAISAVFLIFLV